MATDQNGLELSCDSQATAALFDDTVNAYLRFSKNVGKYAKTLLTAEPDMPLGNCLMGYFFQLMGTRALTSRAERCLAAARSGESTPRERRHADALEAWLRDDLTGAANCWESILIDHPRDLLAAKLAHFMHFYLGDSTCIRDSIARVLPVWSEADAAYGYMLAMYAFGLEESGQYDEAEDYGRQAVALNSNDIWGIHAVAHVLEMQDRSQEGIGWVNELQPHWSKGNNFRYHVAWHGALFHVDRGEAEQALKLYDETIWDAESNEYLDLCNDASLLLRLEMAGVELGQRWTELAAIVSKHTQQHILNFIDPHYVAALAAGGETAAAEAFIAKLQGELEGDWDPDDTYLQVAEHVGLALARGMLAYAERNHGAVVEHLLPVRYRIQRIGGSHAQRDLFAQVLIDSAIKSKQLPLARSLLAERVALRPNNIVALRRYAELLETTGDQGSAAVRQRLAELAA